MDRLTVKDGNSFMPKKMIEDGHSYCEEYCHDPCGEGCPLYDCFQKLADYEDAEENDGLVWKSDIKKVIESAEQMRPYKVPGIPETYSDYCQGWKDACERIFVDINLQED